MAQPFVLTDRQLARSPFPHQEQSLLPRTSKSRTKAVNARTFDSIEEWVGFEACSLRIGERLDDVALETCNPMWYMDDGLGPMTDEVGIRGDLEKVLFLKVNYLARKLGMRFRFTGCGSGTALSSTDMVILDIEQNQNQNVPPSSRVYGNGEAKGPWQWELDGISFSEALGNVNGKQNEVVEALQQLFGDMILDETAVGFISNYNETVFFCRNPGKPKKLFFSPVVHITDAPAEKFLYVLDFAEKNCAWKPMLPRTSVHETHAQGYVIQLPQFVLPPTRFGRKREFPMQKVRVKAKGRTGVVHVQPTSKTYNEDDVHMVPPYPLDKLNVTGDIVGVGKYGNVIKAQVDGVELALKTFDLKRDGALRSFLREQNIYRALEELQGTCVPVLLLIGRLPHTSMVYLGLTYEVKDQKQVRELLLGRQTRSKRVETSILESLQAIHDVGVLHGDVALEHVFYDGFTETVKYIDFEYGSLSATKLELKQEMETMKDLISQHQQQHAITT